MRSFSQLEARSFFHHLIHLFEGSATFAVIFYFCPFQGIPARVRKTFVIAIGIDTAERGPYFLRPG
jgi:hypothetical protein